MTVNSITGNKYITDYKQIGTNEQVTDNSNASDSIFASNQTSTNLQAEEAPSREDLSASYDSAQTKSEKINALKAMYQNAKNEQGIIGKIGDGFKNLFNTKNCSNNIEKAVNSLNENSSDEEIQAVKDMLDKYNSNQDSIVKGTATTGAMVAGAAAGAKIGGILGSVFPGLGNLAGLAIGAVAGAVVGAATSVVINQAENMTDNIKNNSWHNDKNLLKEAGEGALSGASGVIMGGIAGKVTGKVASKVGLTAVENGGKTAFVALAENGTAKVGATVAKNALANAVGTGTAAAAVSSGSYALECAVDDKKDFSLTDMATTATTSFLFGGAMGGVTGGIQGFKGATSFNNAVSQAKVPTGTQAKAETAAKATEEKAPEPKAIEEKAPEPKAIEEGQKTVKTEAKPKVTEEKAPEPKAIEEGQKTAELTTKQEKMQLIDGTKVKSNSPEVIQFEENLGNKLVSGEITETEYANQLLEFYRSKGIHSEALESWAQNGKQLIKHYQIKNLKVDQARSSKIQDKINSLDNPDINFNSETMDTFSDSTRNVLEHINNNSTNAIKAPDGTTMYVSPNATSSRGFTAQRTVIEVTENGTREVTYSWIGTPKSAQNAALVEVNGSQLPVIGGKHTSAAGIVIVSTQDGISTIHPRSFKNFLSMCPS